MNSKDLNIFLSSTFLDLEEARNKVIKFWGVLNSDIIRMEIFGSDETQPKDFCLGKVAECNFFIGIYAERYGSIDEDTGLSLTELEYHEAYQMYLDSKIQGLLLYIIDPKANWNISFVDRDAIKIQKMTDFKKLITQRHTVTYFQNIEDLPFNILRDTIRKLEIGFQNYFKMRSDRIFDFKNKFERPIGMEFFSEDFATLFLGREQEIVELNKQILTHGFSLLIGVSGIGKTSLLKAGILPLLNNLGWKTAVIRPLSNPLHNLKNFLWNEFLEGKVPEAFKLSDVVKTVLDASPNTNLFIAIDQFEDILSNQSTNLIEELTGELLQLYALKNPFLHILVCYRGDVESEIGIIWQRITGASNGLPRFYLKALDNDASERILDKTLDSLSIELKPKILLQRIKEEIATESLANSYRGVFPPFLQMVLLTIYERIGTENSFSEETFNNLNGARGIIGGFLIEQLNLLGKTKDDAIKILVALVNNKGTKVQRTFEELEIASFLNRDDFGNILNRLIDLRLIRNINHSYEIIHDVLANSVLTELISDDDKIIRKFQFLLESKAQSFKSTKSTLSQAEHLLLYKHRKNLRIGKEELDLLISSSNINFCPIMYWIREDNIDLINDSEIESLEHLFQLYNTFFAIHDEPENSDISSLHRTEDLEALAKKIDNWKVPQLFDLLSSGNELITIDVIRMQTKAKANWKKIIGLAGLGLFGEEKDIESVIDALKSSSNSIKVKAVALKSSILLIKKYNKHSLLTTLISDYNGSFWNSVVNDVDSSFNNSFTIDEILRFFKISVNSEKETFLFSILENLITDKDADKIMECLSDIDFTSSEKIVRLLKLLLTKGEKKFMYYIDYLIRLPKHISVYYKYYLHEQIADLATSDDYKIIQSYIITDTYCVEKSEVYNFELKNSENKYFFDWVMSCAFSNLCQHDDMPTLIILLTHHYWTVRNASVKGILRVANADDLEFLLDMAINPGIGISEEQMLHAISVLDIKIYSDQNVLKLQERKWEMEENLHKSLISGEIPF